MNYRAIFLDLDGTTIPNSPDSLPSAKVLAAINRAKANHIVCVATSRPLFFAQKILDMLAPNGLCSVNDSTQIYDPKTREVTHTLYISHEEAKLAYDIVAPTKHAVFLNEGVSEKEYMGGPFPKDLCGFFIPDLDMTEANELITSLTHISSLSVHKVPSHKKDRVHVCVTNALATKLHSVKTIMELLDIKSEETIGVGDGYNDYPLLSACGLKVAMGNAVDDLKSIADVIAPTVEEDGVAVIIDKFLLK